MDHLISFGILALSVKCMATEAGDLSFLQKLFVLQIIFTFLEFILKTILSYIKFLSKGAGVERIDFDTADVPE